MKIYIHTYSEPNVGIFGETITIDWQGLDNQELSNKEFTNPEGTEMSNREYYRKVINDVFDDITGAPVSVKFEDERK